MTMRLTQTEAYRAVLTDDAVNQRVGELTATTEAIAAVDRALLVSAALAEWAHNFNLDEAVEMYASDISEKEHSNAALLSIVNQARQVTARQRQRACAHCEDPEAHE